MANQRAENKEFVLLIHENRNQQEAIQSKNKRDSSVTEPYRNPELWHQDSLHTDDKDIHCSGSKIQNKPKKK